MKAIVIQFQDDMAIDAQHDFESRLKSFLMDYFQGWAYPATFSKAAAQIVSYSYSEEDDGKMYVSPRRKPSRHHVILSRSEVRDEKAIIFNAIQKDLVVLRGLNRPERSKATISETEFDIANQALGKALKAVERQDEAEFLVQISLLKNLFLKYDAIDKNLISVRLIRDYQYGAIIGEQAPNRYQRSEVRRASEIFDTFYQLLQEKKYERDHIELSVDSVRNQNGYLSLQFGYDPVGRGHWDKSHIYELSYNPYVGYGWSLTIYDSEHNSQVLWNYRLFDVDATIRIPENLEFTSRVPVNVTGLFLDEAGRLKIEVNPEFLESVKEGAPELWQKVEKHGILVPGPGDIAARAYLEYERSLRNGETSNDHPKGSKSRSELRNEDEPEEEKKKTEDDTTSVIEAPFEKEFDNFISEAIRLGTDKDFTLPKLQDFLSRYLDWRVRISKFTHDRVRYEAIFSPLRENALTHAWRKILSTKLVPLMREGKTTFSIAFLHSLQRGDLIVPVYFFDDSMAERLSRPENLLIYIFNSSDLVNYGVNLTMNLMSGYIHVPFDKFQKNYVILRPASRSELRQSKDVTIEKILPKLAVYQKIHNRTRKTRIKKKMTKRIARLWVLRHQQLPLPISHEEDDSAFLSVLSDSAAISVLRELDQSKYEISRNGIPLKTDFKAHFVDLPHVPQLDRKKEPLDLLLARQLTPKMIEDGLRGKPVTLKIPQQWLEKIGDYRVSPKSVIVAVMEQRKYRYGIDYDLEIQYRPGAVAISPEWSPTSRAAGISITIHFKKLHRPERLSLFSRSFSGRSEVRSAGTNKAAFVRSDEKGIRGVVYKITDGIIPWSIALYGSQNEMRSLIDEFLKSFPNAAVHSPAQERRSKKWSSAAQIIGLQGDALILGPELVKLGGLALAGTVFGEKPVIALAPTEDIARFVEDFNLQKSKHQQIKLAHSISEAVQLLREINTSLPSRIQAYISSFESPHLSQALKKQLGDQNITRVTPGMFNQTVARAELREFVTELRTRYQRFAQSA
ncbi:MAG TPA: hypothetical protein VD913_02875, partial [bacterium]|nr:hypothetical protein [bacterium]